MVAIVTKDKNGNVVTTVEQLEEWLKKAEKDGYARGYSDGMKESWTPWSYPYTTTNIRLKSSDDPFGPLDPYKLTCDNKHPDDALDALRFATNIDIQANTNGDKIVLTALPKNDEERKILDNAINNMMGRSTSYIGDNFNKL